MTTDHCESLMIKRENWIPGNFIYENPHDYDSICQDSIFLNIDSNKYADPYGTNNPQKSVCEPERRWCEIYEDGTESLYSHHYTSSPSSVNSQTCNDYQFQYHYSDNSKKIDSDASNFSEQHHNRNDYSWTRETAGYTESFFNKSQPMQRRRTETESFSPPIKKRNTANRKERRRTQSINSAFTNLRECIPSVPADTKLSKIKTLRLATTYITHLLESLNSDDPSSCEKFKADLSNHGAKKSNITSYYKLSQTQHKVDKVNTDSTYTKYQNQDETIKKTKGRTGWPQHVWAMELKQEQL